MDTLHNISQALSIALIHSLWQGMLIYLAVRIILLAKPQLTSIKKYHISLVALTGIAIWFAYTFFARLQTFNIPALNTESYTILDENKGIHISSSWLVLPITVKNYMPYVAAFYLLGLVINLVKLGIAWQQIKVIKQSMIAAAILQRQLDILIQRLDIHKQVKVCFSKLVVGPCVIGYFKPILLLPFTFTTQLSAAEVEAILLHELAHIKHNDYFLNLMQQVISVLFFFNPFSYYLGQMISAERENGCDDVVVKLTGAPVIYANALMKLEETRQFEVKLALAATGNKYKLFSRIERMIKSPKPMVNLKHLVLTLLLFIASIGSIAWLNPEIENGRIVSKNGAAAVRKIATILKTVLPEAGAAPHRIKGPAQSDKIVDKQPTQTITNNAAPEKPDTTIAVKKYPAKRKDTTIYYSDHHTVTKTESYIDKEGNKKEYQSTLYFSDRPPSKADEIRKKLMEMPEWKQESDAIGDEFHNSAAWKKSKEDINKAMEGHWYRLDLNGNEEWQINLAKAQDELEHSEAWLTQREKARQFNIKLDQEIRRQLAKEPSQ